MNVFTSLTEYPAEVELAICSIDYCMIQDLLVYLHSYFIEHEILIDRGTSSGKVVRLAFLHHSCKLHTSCINSH